LNEPSLTVVLEETMPHTHLHLKSSHISKLKEFPEEIDPNGMENLESSVILSEGQNENKSQILLTKSVEKA